MNVVDSSGWLEFFTDDINAGFFSTAIKDEEKLIVPTISLFEVFKRVLTERGKDQALEIIALMYTGKIVDLSKEIALLAAQLSHEYLLPMADSIILATARQEGATLWTQDEHFKRIDDVKYIDKRY